MAIFNIQTINGEVKHDFAFQLIEAIHFQNWYTDQVTHEVIKSDHVSGGEGIIPVGSLEFVFMHLSNEFGIQKKDIQPLNIPNELMHPKFLKRNCSYLDKTELQRRKEMLFVKSATSYKAFIDVTASFDSLPEDTYLVSETVDIESEWRFFVGNNKLLSMHCYLGDFTLTPDFELVNEMLQAYQSGPAFYTLDVGVNQKGTFIIEVHPIVSCGLYGFNQNQILPQMMINGFHYMRDQGLQQKEIRERTAR